jgi:hypothetical protein
LITSAIIPEKIPNNWAPDLNCEGTGLLGLPGAPGPPGLPGIGDILLKAFTTDFDAFAAFAAFAALGDLDLRAAIFIIFYFLQDIFYFFITRLKITSLYINVANV